MKKSIKTSFLAGLSLLLFNCSSDDSAPIIEGPCPGPEIIVEKTPYLSKIQQYFYESPDTNREGNQQDKAIEMAYNFVYDADFELQHITYTDAVYKNQVVVQEQNLQLQPTLDQQGRLQLWEIKEDGVTIDDYVYQYTGDQLTAITFNLGSQGGSFTSKLSYNNRNQMILNEALEANILVDYIYNSQNQLNKMKFNGQNIGLTYDDKKSPFYNLPFDLTSVLINFNLIIPYTYHFTNNINSIVIEGQTLYVDYTYNEDNLPVKAMFYTMENENKMLDFEINFTYKIKETIVEQPKL